jgi:hypothetical protein
MDRSSRGHALSRAPRHQGQIDHSLPARSRFTIPHPVLPTQVSGPMEPAAPGRELSRKCLHFSSLRMRACFIMGLIQCAQLRNSASEGEAVTGVRNRWPICEPNGGWSRQVADNANGAPLPGIRHGSGYGNHRHGGGLSLKSGVFDPVGETRKPSQTGPSSSQKRCDVNQDGRKGSE